MTYTPSARKRNFLIAAFLFAMAFCNLVLLFQEAPKLKNGYQDFAIYYAAAKMLREGRSAVLYNLAVQYQTQLTFAPNVPIRRAALPYNHPPFEAVWFVPFTFLKFWPAYLVWTGLNLMMLAASVILLRRYPRIRDVHPVLAGGAVLAFFPLVNGLLQGQDVILLMFLTVVALTCLDRGADAAAGAWLGVGLFRPHMVVPLVLLLAARRWRMLLGFVPVAVALTGITVLVMGSGGPLAYIRFVLFVERSGIGNFGSKVVPNLRGLIGSLLGHFSKPLAAALIVATSVIVFAAALRRIRNGYDSIVHSFCLAGVTTILVSFHALSYDLTLLMPLILFLLGAAMTASTQEYRAGRLLLLFLLFLTAVQIYLNFQVGLYFWFGLVILWLYFRLMRMPAPSAEPA
jgi:hypothetical protein